MDIEKLKSMADRLHDYLETEEGKASLIEYFGGQERREQVERTQIERFHQKYGSNLDEVIAHIEAYYESDAYYNREVRKLGYEPRTPLYSFLYKYAEKYGKSTWARKHMSGFNNIAYYIGESYVIRVLHGQGSCVQVYKR